jgi:putative colanic acid biosynthesis UDP-glucose lipid carrier transferase
MNQPVLLRSSLSVALVSLLQATLPGVAVGTLFVLLCMLRGVVLDPLILALAALSAVLTILILRTGREAGPTLQLDLGALAFDITIRWAVVLALLFGLAYITKFGEHYPRSVVLPWAVLTPPLLFAVTAALHVLMRRVVLSQHNQRSAVIVGVNVASLQLADRLATHPELCTRVAGFFDDRSLDRVEPMGDFQLLGKLKDLIEYVQREKIDVIFVALPIRHVQRVMDLLDDLRDSTASIYFVPDVFVFDLIQSRTAEIMGIPVVALCETPFYGYRGVMKRLTDLSFTLGILVFALPVMLVIAMLVKLTSPGPVIFRQRRYGLDGQEILVYKFRSMTVTEDGATITQATKQDSRVTPIGRILRKYSLDELPQLFNVLQGRMSLVGPRPHAVAHNEQYRRLIKGYMLRHKVLPGITGLAQINGCRGETAELEQMQARIDYDLDYLRRWTPSLDFKILVKTAQRLLRDSKAY